MQRFAPALSKPFVSLCIILEEVFAKEHLGRGILMSAGQDNVNNELDGSSQQSLIDAIDRNTAATRSIGLFLFGSFFWVLGGAGILLLPFLMGFAGDDISNVFSLIGFGLISFGTIRSVLLALKEFRYSQFF
jgi:hypothetical protein